LVSTTPTSGLFILLCLAALFTALGCGIAAFAEKLLIIGSKRECLSTIAAHELQILSHMFLSSVGRAFCWVESNVGGRRFK
jgi:hypothetical protein